MSEMPSHEQNCSVIEETLLEPIVGFDDFRKLKKGYGNYPIDKSNEHFNEPLVNIVDYGIAGQAYYSRKNAATKDAVEGVPNELFLRKSVLEKLAFINNALANPEISDFFGGEVELYIEDAHRDVDLQRQLHDNWFPRLIRNQNTDIAEDELAERVENMIAIPSDDPQKPSPHVTGVAFDVILRYKQPDLGYVEGVNVPMGHLDGEVSDRIMPDYFEQNMPQSDGDKLAQRNRRAFYAIMTGKAFGRDTELANNPTDWWHWSYGDQMWAKLRHQPAAFYSIANLS
jgi:D-alanyl-D-alanine dipeptidase